MGSLDFAGKSFDDCIRMYFREFFPPGEADPIYRMMEKFGEHFASVNPGIFDPEGDAPLVLAYAGIQNILIFVGCLSGCWQ